jgi:DNA-binding NtrC family response regulator
MISKKILIVDDDLSHLTAMEKVLDIYNYKVTCCATAEEAVSKLQDEVFGILITDLRMQGMDGLGLIKVAKKNHPKISTILMTGLASDEIRLKAKQEEVNGFFPKPIEWDELISSLDVLTRKGMAGKQDIQRNDGEYIHPG